MIVVWVDVTGNRHQENVRMVSIYPDLAIIYHYDGRKEEVTNPQSVCCVEDTNNAAA